VTWTFARSIRLWLPTLAASLSFASAASAAPCEVPDNGGTAELPPAGCEYTGDSSGGITQKYVIFAGLPPGTTIEMVPRHTDFSCGSVSACSTAMPPGVCEEPGGGLGGDVSCSNATLHLQVTGTGSLAGFARNLSLPLSWETHSAPRTPGDPVQSFAAEMVSMRADLPGDPDFSLLSIRAGSAEGLPGTGRTNLKQLPFSGWNVDSFFYLTYEIDFVGAPGSMLEGLAGLASGTIGIRAGEPVPWAGTITQIIDSTGDGAGNTLSSPWGLAVDSSGNVYVAGSLSDNAFKITPGGVISEIIDSTGDGAGNSLNEGTGVAVDSGGNVFVSGGFSDNAFKIASGGAITEIIDATGDGLVSLSRTFGIALDSIGNTYVVGFFSNNVFRITPGGAITQIIDASGDRAGNLLSSPMGVAVDSSGNVYVTGGLTDNAFKIDTPGTCNTFGTPCTITEIIDTSGDGIGNTLVGTQAVAVDSSGNVYVTGGLSDNAFKITPGGAISEIIDVGGDGTGNGLAEPVGITVDSSGNIYVAGKISNNSFEITPGGGITEIIDATGDGAGNTLVMPFSIVVDSSGNVFVTGGASDGVFKIAPDDRPPNHAGELWSDNFSDGEHTTNPSWIETDGSGGAAGSIWDASSGRFVILGASIGAGYDVGGYVPVPFSDGYVRVEMRLSGTITSNMRGVSLRSSGGDSYYLAMIPDNGGYAIGKINAGPAETIASSAQPLSYTAPSYTLILEALDNGPDVDLSAWVFETGQPIPATPTLSGTDTAALTPVRDSGNAAVWAYASDFGSIHVDFDNASAHDHAVPEPGALLSLASGAALLMLLHRRRASRVQ